MAKRSRPPTLLTLAQRTVREAGLFGRGDRVLVACSGGPDSNALLHALALLRRRIGHELIAVGVDHGLRAAAADELALARGVADDHGVRFERVELTVPSGPNLQARARQARHESIQQVAQGVSAAVIATGHTRDDRAETVLIRLLRGAGPHGLAALPAMAPAISGAGAGLVRPIIQASRHDVMAHLKRHDVPYAMDPSNQDSRFLRVRVRQEVMPLLMELSPGIVGHLASLADMLQQDRDERLDGGADADAASGLTRAQRQAVERALRLGREHITVRVSGGRDLRIRFFDGTPVVIDEQ